jgi:hypothetical protein
MISKYEYIFAESALYVNQHGKSRAQPPACASQAALKAKRILGKTGL